MLKQIIIIIGTCLPTLVAATNPFFGYEHENMVYGGIGQGLSTGWLLPSTRDELVPFAALHVGYAVPNTVFHLPGRQSLNVVGLIGWGTSVDSRYKHPVTGEFPIFWNWKEIAETAQILYLHQDAALLWGSDWYTGIGVGAGMQRHQNKRIETKLMFSFRIFAGYILTDNWRAEVFFQHFSNGSTGINFSYNSIGLGLGYSF